MLFIRQGATHKVVLGPAVAVGDGFTPVTTLALSTADEAAAILHDNGTIVDISGYTWAAITGADGYYHLTLQAGITGTVGHLSVVVNDDSLCLPLPRAEFTVLEEAVYDALFASSAAGAFSGLTAILGTPSDLGGGATLADNNADMAGGTFSSATDSQEAIRNRGDSAWITATGFATHTASDVWAVATRQLTGTQAFNLTGDITGNLSGSVGSVTGNVGGISGTIQTLDALDTAQDSQHAATQAAIGTPPDLGGGATLADNNADMAGGTFSGATDSLEALRNRGDAAWITATGFATHSASDVWAVGTRTLTAIDEDNTTLDIDAAVRAAVGMSSANLDTQLGNLPTLAEILAGGDIDGYTIEEALKIGLAALAGKGSGLGTTTGVYRAVDDSKARITATIDADGNRSAVTLDATG